jgi:hypothetical protein
VVGGDLFVVKDGDIFANCIGRVDHALSAIDANVAYSGCDD